MLKLKNIADKLLMSICFLFVLFFHSCKSEQDLTKDKLIGSWDIADINYKEKKYIENLLINAFTIEENGTITIPDTIDSKIEDTGIISNWDLKDDGRNPLEIEINCEKNKVFNGSFRIRFFKDYQNKLLGIELKSDNTSILAFKVLQNFDIDGENWDNPNK